MIYEFCCSFPRFLSPQKAFWPTHRSTENSLNSSLESKMDVFLCRNLVQLPCESKMSSHQNRIDFILILVFWHVHFQHSSGHDPRASNLTAPTSGELLAKRLAERAELWLWPMITPRLPACLTDVSSYGPAIMTVCVSVFTAELLLCPVERKWTIKVSFDDLSKYMLLFLSNCVNPTILSILLWDVCVAVVWKSIQIRSLN